MKRVLKFFGFLFELILCNWNLILLILVICLLFNYASFANNCAMRFSRVYPYSCAIDSIYEDELKNIKLIPGGNVKKIECLDIDDEDYEGIGTITFYMQDGDDIRFGALGHSLNNNTTKEKVEVISGNVFDLNIISIDKSDENTIGALNGMYITRLKNGIVEKNTYSGLYGKIYNNNVITGKKSLNICLEKDIKKGKAVLLSDLVNKELKEYDIEILEVNQSPDKVAPSMVIEIVDKELLEITGGIIQGMSGTPILQDGKIIGAISNVFVSNTEKGLAISIEDMILDSGYMN